MSQLSYIDYDFDNPCDFDDFLRRVEERVRVVHRLRVENKSHNSDAHPNPPQYAGAWRLWMGVE